MDIYENNNLEILDEKFKLIKREIYFINNSKYLDGPYNADGHINNCNITLKSSLK
jgi:hypothetical protein